MIGWLIVTVGDARTCAYESSRSSITMHVSWSRSRAWSHCHYVIYPRPILSSAYKEMSFISLFLQISSFKYLMSSSSWVVDHLLHILRAEQAYRESDKKKGRQSTSSRKSEPSDRKSPFWNYTYDGKSLKARFCPSITIFALSPL